VDLGGFQRAAGLRLELRLERGAAAPRFDAAAAAAIAVRRVCDLVRARAGQGIVAPLAGNGVRAGQDAPADADPAADAGAGDDAEDDVAPGSGAVGRFRQREAVGVVGDA